MGGFSDLIRDFTALADNLTQSIQVDVTHYMWLGTYDSHGKPELGAGVLRKALAEKKQRTVRTSADEMTQTDSIITFLRPVPITKFDKFRLPDGTIAPMLNVGGMFDPLTNDAYMDVVYLG